MNRQEYDQLDSNGRVNCPDCGYSSTRPYLNCGCPSSKTGCGYSSDGTRHINLYHHDCEDAQCIYKERKRQVEKEIIRNTET